MKKFSIIVPVYNVERYLSICIQSILCQSTCDYEMILIDDGSTDRSGEICDKYAQKYSNIHVIHQENQGLSAARNRGIEIAGGEYLLFLDSDDYYLNSNCLDKIEQKTDNADIVVFNWVSVDESHPSKSLHPKGPMSHLKAFYSNGKEYLEDAFFQMAAYPWYVWLYAIRKDYWMQQSFQFKTGVCYEDVQLTYRILIKAQGIHVIKDGIYAYREKREGSIVTEFKKTTATDLLSHCQKNIEEIENEPNISKNLKRYLCNNFSGHFYYVLNRVYRVAKEDQDKLLNDLKKAQWICKYTVFGIKHSIEYVMVLLLGVRKTAKIVGWLHAVIYKSRKICNGKN